MKEFTNVTIPVTSSAIHVNLLVPSWISCQGGERVARGHFHERVGESPVHWLPPGVGFTPKPFSVSENGPIKNFLRSNSIFIYS